MLRARQQYVWKNAVAFVLLSSLSLGIYLYTFNFLAKDEFDDIEVPPISEEDLIKLRAEYQEDLKKENK